MLDGLQAMRLAERVPPIAMVPRSFVIEDFFVFWIAFMFFFFLGTFVPFVLMQPCVSQICTVLWT
jgi:hypothetical protein